MDTNLPTYAIVRLDRGRWRVGVTVDGRIVAAYAREASARRDLEQIASYAELTGKLNYLARQWERTSVIWDGNTHYITIFTEDVTADDELAKTIDVAPVDRTTAIAEARAADERIATLWDAYWVARQPLDEASAKATDLRKRLKQLGSSSLPSSQAIVTRKLDAALAEAEAIRPTVDAARAAAIKLDAELYTGWQRFYLVIHLHGSQDCSSFKPTTRIGWRPELSGLTEEEAVELAGEALCSKCFPSAPVALTVKPTDPTVCPGSGQPYDREKLTGRERAHFSPEGTCGTCGKRTALASRGSSKIRKHKRPTD